LVRLSDLTVPAGCARRGRANLFSNCTLYTRIFGMLDDFMGGFATFAPGRQCRQALATALCAAFIAGTQGAAAAPPAQLPFFADCAGRLTAELSYDWLLQRPTAAETEAQLETTRAILDTLITPQTDMAARAILIEARAAHAALLSRAMLAGGADAARLARHRVTPCRRLILG
jgi:hypothetical protein